MPPTHHHAHLSARARTRCRSCGAPIFFAATPKGARIPIDAEPTEFGTILLGLPDETTDDPIVLAITALGKHVELPKPRWTSHFATCPESDEWRRRREKR